MQISYAEMEGAGNRILIVDERASGRPPPPSERVERLGNAGTGPGFDQLMWLGPAHSEAALASYRVFNADGSEAEQCGNGVRCVAWLLGRASGLESCRLDSPVGPVDARLLDGGRVSVDMGVPRFEPASIPFVAEKSAKSHEIDVNGRQMVVSVVSMGNPHCVLRVASVAGADLATLGPALERHARFPAGCNVGVLAVRDRAAIDLRVHERGVGETRACGTGACAAVVAAHRLGLVDETVSVHLPGGQLVVSWRRPGDRVWLTGNAEWRSEGTIDV